MLAELRKVRFPVEIGFLLAFCIFLPLVEAPKNLALIGFFVTWIVNRWRTRDFGGPWRTADTLVALWIGGAYVSASFAGLSGHPWSKTGDVALSTLLFWLVLRSGYGATEVRLTLGALVVSTLLGLAQAYWNMWSGVGKTGLLQLNSVGHVNHTAIYLAIMFGLCAGWVFDRWPAWSAGRRMAGTFVATLVFLSLLPTTSRAAVGIGLLLPPLLALAWWRRWRTLVIANAIAMAFVTVALISIAPRVVEKQIEFSSSQNTLSFRAGIWRSGIAAWEEYPWFGVGKNNYEAITPELIGSWRAAAGKEFDRSRFERAPHAHNLYVNTLAERGILGLVTLALAMLGILVALVRCRPRPEDGDAAWISWSGAASAWIVTAGIGTVNTTLHHEHGLLAMLLTAIWLTTLRTRRAS